MPSRNELNARARAVGFDPATIANDSKLEQKVLFLEKRVSAVTGTVASTTLTSDATNVVDGDTVTIGSLSSSSGVGTTYTFKDTLVPGTANQVKIGADAATSLDNIKAAVTLTGTPGTDYTAATQLHPTVTATTNTDTTQLFVARDTNAGGDFTSTETSAHLSFPGVTFASGTANVAGVVAAAGAGTRDTNAGIAGDKNTSL